MASLFECVYQIEKINVAITFKFFMLTVYFMIINKNEFYQSVFDQK